MRRSALTRYFLGAHSPQGFFSYFQYLIDLHTAEKVYILKGGPGTGKSTLLKSLAEEASANGHFVEYIHCSADPYSLDGILLPSLRIAFVDGTAPHVIDPAYPLAVDKILNLADFLKEKEMEKNKNQIISLSDGLKDCYDSAYLYIRAAREAQLDIFNLAGKFLLLPKMTKHITNSLKPLTKKPLLKESKIQKRFISAICNTGIISFSNNLSVNYEHVVLLDDRYGIAAVYMAEAAGQLKKAGYDLDLYYSPLGPTTDIEAMAVPEANTVYITSTPLIPYDGVYEKKINLLRFIETAPLRAYRQRFRFDNKLLLELIDAAVEQLHLAKERHDELEAYYRVNMDFCGIDKLTAKILKEIL